MGEMLEVETSFKYLDATLSKDGTCRCPNENKHDDRSDFQTKQVVDNQFKAGTASTSPS
ncbi:hypothetical protein DPMN_129010 [Dreissena polymorpha]|uniref:Uncharacterized protein n=1 Tax=Dreissena polymorpha TaxID=45954 RepID=A0A9D4H4Z8_DREPO|nr:hypothetical protein DPMN_129010 [Dreissena polymorpha]